MSTNLEPAKVFTYQDLEVFHETSLRESGKAESTINNHRTAFNTWLAFAVWKDEDFQDGSGKPVSSADPVGKELCLDFDKCQAKYLDKVTPSTKTDRKSILKQIQASWLRMLNKQVLPQTFSAVLNHLKEQKGESHESLAKVCGVSIGKISNWHSADKLPTGKDLKHVSTLERHYDLQPGTLVATLPKFMLGRQSALVGPNATPHRAYLSNMKGKGYAKRLDLFTDQQRQEWELLFRLYTDPVWAAAQGLNRHKRGWRIRKNTGDCPTGQIKLGYIENFYGFLILPSEPADPSLRDVKFDPANKSHQGVKGFDPILMGKGLNEKKLSLALFTNVSLISEYLGFLKRRSFNGSYSSDVRNFLSFCRQLNRPEKGFLYQFPNYSKRAVPQVRNLKKWRELCVESHRKLHNMITNIASSDDENERFSQPRDSTLKVVKPLIMQREHPITVLFDIAEGFRRDFELAEDPVRKAVFFRNMIMNEILASNPMRAINIAEMKFIPGAKGEEDEPTNLYKTPEAEYRLKYEAHELKNGAKRGRYDLPVNAEFTKDLDEYFSKWRPLLEDADTCSYVFRPGKSICQRRKRQNAPSSKKRPKPMTIVHLSGVQRRASQIYLAPCAGFGLHAARHFAATEYLKHNPGGYTVAAIILHDSEEMVRDTYSWVTPDDIIPFWNSHLMSVVRKSRKEAVYDYA